MRSSLISERRKELSSPLWQKLPSSALTCGMLSLSPQRALLKLSSSIVLVRTEVGVQSDDFSLDVAKIPYDLCGVIVASTFA
jgi:hypothetical protein